MGYVGNQQAEGFVQRPTKQDLTGATGDTLTLTHAVSKEEDIDLYINNVKQEPTTAYTVADTVVTLTGDVVASDDIYVVYNSLALQTVVPPDGSVTSAKLVYPLTTFSSTGIDDNATNTAMTLDSSGNVGIGTTSPNEKVTIVSSSSASYLQLCDSSTGTTSGDGLFLGSFNGASELKTKESTHLSFGTNNTERMRIDSSGNLLLGTTSLGLYDNTSGGGLEVVTAAGGSELGVANTSNCAYFNRMGSDGDTVKFFNRGATVGTVQTTSSSTSYNTSSDYRLKENVTDITGATDRLKQLNPVRFNFISDADTTVDGFLAHEVQSVVPEAITGTHNEVDDEGSPVYQGIDQSKLVPLLVATIQELEARIAALEAE